MSRLLCELGFGRFRAELEGRSALFVDGECVGEHEKSTDGDEPVLVYAPGRPSRPGTIDVALLAGALQPTLSSHRLSSVCSHYGIHVDSAEPQRALAQLLEALLSEAEGVDRDVVGLLSELTPAPLSELMVRLLGRPAGVACPEAAPDLPQGGAGPVWSTVEEAFAIDGPIAGRFSRYELRAGQQDMARQVAAVFARGGALSVEAGPGTGKTFAYLVPALLQILSDPATRVVVCTRTKQLQEQLFGRDVPLLLACAPRTVSVALLKGRENYLCLRRWEGAIQSAGQRIGGGDPLLLVPLVRWLAETKTGDIDENAAFLSQPGAAEAWQGLNDSPFYCTAAYCSRANECFSVRARRRARAASLVIVNHSLLLSDRAANGVVLGKYSHLVVDEAHAFEPAARSGFTVSLSRRKVERLADEVYPSRRRRLGWIHRLPIPLGDEDVRRVTDPLGSLRIQTARLFAAVEPLAGDELRGDLPPWGAEASEFEAVSYSASQVEDALRGLAERLEEQEEPDLSRQAESLAAAFRDLASVATLFGRGADENHVHWYESARPGLEMHATPLDIAAILEALLYPSLEALVLTSATLSLDRSFDFVHDSLGVLDAFGTVGQAIVESPFSYEDRMRICVCTGFPEVFDSGAYVEALSSFLLDLAALGRKGLVLFTSYDMLRSVRDRVLDRIPTLAQGVDGPRSKIVEQFRQEDGAGLLLGTDSFWEGVDLPGTDAEFLVVTRLPFSVPTDPVFRALARRAAREGRDPFSSLAVPQAVLRLRQGVGRLIRTLDDRGVVFITDRRIVSRAYGKSFAAALPVPLEVFGDAHGMVEEAVRWFAGAKTAREHPAGGVGN